MRMCEVDGCENKHEGRGLCVKHYFRWRRNGTLVRKYRKSGAAITAKEILEFTAPRVVEETLGPCLEWTGPGGFDGHGYAQVQYKGETKRVHRLLFELLHGNVLPKIEVCHRCDNKACVNPDHLVVGSHWENMDDWFGSK